MARIKDYVKIVLIDSVALLCMIAALLIGWLPGPGGIPLFLVGLGLFAINHEWAERYINLLLKYSNRISDLIFTPKLRVFFDLLSPTIIIWGAYILIYSNKIWTIATGIVFIGLGIAIFFKNRNRWKNLRTWLSR